MDDNPEVSINDAPNNNDCIETNTVNFEISTPAIESSDKSNLSFTEYCESPVNQNYCETSKIYVEPSSKSHELYKPQTCNDLNKICDDSFNQNETTYCNEVTLQIDAKENVCVHSIPSTEVICDPLSTNNSYKSTINLNIGNTLNDSQNLDKEIRYCFENDTPLMHQNEGTTNGDLSKNKMNHSSQWINNLNESKNSANLNDSSKKIDHLNESKLDDLSHRLDEAKNLSEKINESIMSDSSQRIDHLNESKNKSDDLSHRLDEGKTHMKMINGDLGIDNLTFVNDDEKKQFDSIELSKFNNVERTDLSEAVNLEVINMKPLASTSSISENDSKLLNNIPVKNNNDIDVNNPYNEYFIPVNEHKKYLRGEKLYVTKDKRTKNGSKKCLCWLFSATLILALIIVALIYAKKLENKTIEHIESVEPSVSPIKEKKELALKNEDRTKNSIGPTKSPTMHSALPIIINQNETIVTEENNGSKLTVGIMIIGNSTASTYETPFTSPPFSTTSIPFPVTDLSYIAVPNSAEGNFSIINLENSSFKMVSPEFKEFSNGLEVYLKNLILDKINFQNTSGNDHHTNPKNFNVKIIAFMSENSNVFYRISWENNNQTDIVSIDKLKQIIFDHLHSNDNYFGKHKINNDTLTLNEIINKCQIDNNKCKQKCYFDRNELNFKCGCTTNEYLADDNVSCVKKGAMNLKSVKRMIEPVKNLKKNDNLKKLKKVNDGDSSLIEATLQSFYDKNDDLKSHVIGFETPIVKSLKSTDDQVFKTLENIEIIPKQEEKNNSTMGKLLSKLQDNKKPLIKNKFNSVLKNITAVSKKGKVRKLNNSSQEDQNEKLLSDETNSSEILNSEHLKLNLDTSNINKNSGSKVNVENKFRDDNSRDKLVQIAKDTFNTRRNKLESVSNETLANTLNEKFDKILKGNLESISKEKLENNRKEKLENLESIQNEKFEKGGKFLNGSKEKLENTLKLNDSKMKFSNNKKMYNKIGMSGITGDYFKCSIGGNSISNGSDYISIDKRCDSFIDCTDKSDEIQCELIECLNNFQCNNGQCIPKNFVCNGIVDCLDYSDEQKCDPSEKSTPIDRSRIDCNLKNVEVYNCNLGGCIQKNQRCDGKPQCEDRSDEWNCKKIDYLNVKNKPAQFKSMNSSSSELMNDKKFKKKSKNYDLSYITNPYYLSTVTEMTKDKSIGDKSKDIYNYAKIDDKINKTNNETSKYFLIATPDDKWYPICADSWNLDYSDKLCNDLSYDYAVQSKIVSLDKSQQQDKYWHLKSRVADESFKNVLNNFEIKDYCDSNSIVSISCEKYECGKTSIFDLLSEENQFEIFKNSMNKIKKWPYNGLLFNKRNNEFCIGTIIKPTWLITSSNCLYEKSEKNISSNDWVFALNGEFLNLTVVNAEKLIAVAEFINYPQDHYIKFPNKNEISLVRLNSNAISNDQKQSAICLTDKPLRSEQFCVTLHWNIQKINLKETMRLKQQLKYTPVSIVPSEDCNSTMTYNRLIESDQVHCANNVPLDDIEFPCYNELSNPLMCYDEFTNSWQLNGLINYNSVCDLDSVPSVYSTINANLVNWINNVITT